MAEQDDPKQPEQADAKPLTDEDLEQVPGGASFAPQPEPPRLPRELRVDPIKPALD